MGKNDEEEAFERGRPEAPEAPREPKKRKKVVSKDPKGAEKKRKMREEELTDDEQKLSSDSESNISCHIVII